MKHTLTITCSNFTNGENIPPKFTCDGANINPPLDIEGLPDETKSMVLFVDDPDAPMGIYDHWVVWNIIPTATIDENSIPGIEGLNSFNKHHYGGPCPPSGIHRYFFKAYALDTALELNPSSRKGVVEKAMKGHILAQGELMGRYSRSG